MANIKEIEVTIGVDLEGFSNEELCGELEGRGFNICPTKYDWQVLADYVACGETLDALQLIERLSWGEVNAICTMNYAKVQKQTQGKAA